MGLASGKRNANERKRVVVVTIAENHVVICSPPEGGCCCFAVVAFQVADRLSIFPEWGELDPGLVVVGLLVEAAGVAEHLAILRPTPEGGLLGPTVHAGTCQGRGLGMTSWKAKEC